MSRLFTLAATVCLVASACSPTMARTNEPAKDDAQRPSSTETSPSETSPVDGATYLALDDDRYGSYGAAPDAPHLGQAAPALELPDAQGGVFSLAQHEGPVLVMFYRGFW